MDELKGKVESDLSAEEKMMEEYDLAHIAVFLTRLTAGRDRNDRKSGLASPTHTANLWRPVLGCTDIFSRSLRLAYFPIAPIS